MSYINNETASGVVNGVNKTFTTAGNIYEINYVVVDGVIYSGGVTFIAGTNSFLLEDAPVALPPVVSYYNSVPSLPGSTGITVASLRGEFLKRKKDISDIDSIAGTFLQWLNYINRAAYRELTNVQPEQYIKSQIYTISGGTSTYALPTDFDNLNPQGTGLYRLGADNQDTDYRLPMTGFGSTKTGFYMNSSAFTLTPQPEDTQSLKLRYIPQLTDLTLETEELIIPKRFSEHIMNVLDNLYTIWDEDNGAEAWNNERVVNSLQELLNHIKPDGSAYFIPDYTSNYY